MSEGEQEDEAQKTEDPTAKKLADARKKGQVPMSREINSWVMLFSGTLIIGTLAGPMMMGLTEIMTAYIERAHSIPSAPGGLKIALADGTKEVFKVIALPFFMLFCMAFFSSFLQIGPLWSFETLKPALSKISPKKGFGRLFSSRSLMEFVKGLFKIAVVSAVGIVIVAPYFGTFEVFVGMPIPYMMDEIQSMVIRMMIGILIALLIIAAIDLVYQRIEHDKKMRMTKQEVKDEYKQMEGDPHIKARLRQLRSEKARQRMMQAVPSADVVITNPTHYAIALKYDPESMDAPLCLAKGMDELALRIRETAKENNIVLFENKPLARALYDTVEIDQTIPTEHFAAVAEVISFVFKSRK